MATWKEPSLELRRGIPGQDYCIVYQGDAGSGILRRKTLEGAVTAAVNCADKGCQAAVYDKEGNPVE